MERRKFLKSIAAIASTPLLPSNMISVSASGVPAAFSPTVYAKAVSLVSDSAYFSSSHLASSLGLSEEISKLVVSRLKAEGLAGSMGKSSLLFSKSYYPKHTKIAVEAAANIVRTSSSVQAESGSNTLKKVQSTIEKIDSEEKTLETELEIEAKQLQNSSELNEPSESILALKEEKTKELSDELSHELNAKTNISARQEIQTDTQIENEQGVDEELDIKEQA